MIVKTTWSTLSSIATTKNLETSIQFSENVTGYQIFLVDNQIIYETFIFIDTSGLNAADIGPNNANKTDFETNFKTGANGDISIKVLAQLVSGGADQNVIITDGVSGDEAAVDASGRLLVSTQPPTPPATATPVIQTADGDLGNNTLDNQFYTVTSGKTLTVQRFEGAGEGGANNGWFIELYEDPNGVGDAGSPVQGSWVLISLIVIQELGDSKFVDLTPTLLVGDGTRRVVLRRVRLGGGGAKRGFAKFSGFEE